MTTEGVEHESRRATHAHLALGYLLLLLSTGAALFFESSGRLYGLLALSALAAGWLPWLLSVHPSRTERPGRAVVFYIGLSAISTVLVSISSAFTLFASVGYPYAIALFPAGWSVFAVAGTAVLMLAAQSGTLLEPSAFSSVPQYLVLIAIAAPLIAAGWLSGRQSEKRKKDILDLAEANARLEAAMRENEQLQSQLVEHARQAGALDERQRMTSEIHDTIAQGLAGIITQLNAAEVALPDGEQVLDRLGKARSMARDSLTEARRSVHALGPASLEEAHLPDAIREMADRWAADQAIEAAVATDGVPRPLPTAVEIVLYRVAQESLSNVAKHASATRAEITLSYSDSMARLRVQDNGAGFDVDKATTGTPSADGSGFGLGGMQQRVRSASGTFQIDSSPGAGTTVLVTVPVPAEDGR